MEIIVRHNVRIVFSPRQKKPSFKVVVVYLTDDGGLMETNDVHAETEFQIKFRLFIGTSNKWGFTFENQVYKYGSFTSSGHKGGE